ncbi:ABC transporter permease [Azospirillum argentinense]|uniref:ABC transporter permease n=1 Tax=Azospirillum argentinense TaxID=2970906 RepID=UPI00200016FB|nr:ABC transporter permease [Azospirillum argentinense]
MRAWAAPSPEHWLGCDAVGRDVLSRLIVGSRASLTTATAAVVLATALGGGLGLLAGTIGGWTDRLVVLLVDLGLAFPKPVVALLLTAAWGPGEPALVVALGIAASPAIARLTRAQVMVVRAELFVLAALAGGATPGHVLLRHLLPGSLPVLAASAGAALGQTMLAEAALSFLGLGLQEPAVSWGGLIRDGLPALRTAPVLALSASAAVFVAVAGVNAAADGALEALNGRAVGSRHQASP